MDAPNPIALFNSQYRCRYFLLFLFLLTSLSLSACTRVTKGTEPNPKPVEVKKPAPPVATWLGNPERNYYGSGPWKDGQLEIVWEFKTSSTSGRFHQRSLGRHVLAGPAIGRR